MPRIKGTFLEKLEQGPVIGDGGFVFALEKRGYVTAGPWTPEAVIEHPEAVKQIHREFVRAGSDVNQAFTFYASEDKLNNRGNKAGHYGVYNVNKAACEVVREIVDQDSDGYGLVAGGVSQTPAYLTFKDKEKVKEEVKKQLVVFKEQKVDLMICEYYEHVEECEWHVEAVREFMPGVPVCASMAINEFSDASGVETGECGLRLVKAGADVVGINCHFDPFKSIDAVKKMIAAIEAAGLKAHYMVQPLGYHTPDAGVQGFIDLPEFPFALEPRTISRWDAARYAREAYDAGIRFIGGCCGFEPYHIRALSEELSKERSGYFPANCLHGAKCLEIHTKPWVRARASHKYWTSQNPCTGRPYSAAMSKPDAWGITVGHTLLKQHESATTIEELESGEALKRSK